LTASTGKTRKLWTPSSSTAIRESSGQLLGQLSAAYLFRTFLSPFCRRWKLWPARSRKQRDW